MAVKLLVGGEAELLLKDPIFQHQWNSLYNDCAWATPCQSSGFVTTWYEIYRESFQPVLVCGLVADSTEYASVSQQLKLPPLMQIPNALSGLLTLAISSDFKQLIVAGTPQAEYHTWLARTEGGDTFIESAIEALSNRFAGLTLTFQYLPPLAPRQWLSQDRKSILTARMRPLMKLGDGEKIGKSLKKTGNKSRLNRLKRLGDVRFEQLHTEAELAAVFDEIIAYYDFRQGAVNNSLPFQNDPLKKSFQLALMRVKDLQHVTVLKVGDRVLAAHIGLYNRQQCILGIPLHSPFQAIHSPGKLHILMLGLELVKEGIEVLDLTPGGDAYKERFATDWDEVYVLDIFLGNRSWRKQQAELKLRSKAIVKGLMLATGIDLKTIVASIKSIDWKRNIGSKLGHNPEDNLYYYKAETIEVTNHHPSIKRDSIDDLLRFQPVNSSETRQKFLSKCLERIEAGKHVYTWVENGCLLCCSWLVERQEKFVFTELGPEYIFESESAFIYDFYSHPIALDEIANKFQALLEQMLDDAVSIYGAKQIYMTVLADDPRQEMIQQASLNYLDTVDK
jgi:Acetyltransferase (GNAT) domain